MRWIRLALPCFFCILLISCTKEPAPPPSPLLGHTGNYTVSAVIRRGAFTAEAAVERLSPDYAAVRFSAPDSLAGMAFIFQPEWVTVECGGLETRFHPQSLPDSAFAGAIVSALSRAIQQNAVTAELSDSGAILRGSIDAGSFQLHLEPEGDRLLKLLIPAAELEIAFTDFTFLD